MLKGMQGKKKNSDSTVALWLENGLMGRRDKFTAGQSIKISIRQTLS